MFTTLSIMAQDKMVKHGSVDLQSRNPGFIHHPLEWYFCKSALLFGVAATDI